VSPDVYSKNMETLVFILSNCDLLNTEEFCGPMAELFISYGLDDREFKSRPTHFSPIFFLENLKRY
jgi:hypothetical protein